MRLMPPMMIRPANTPKQCRQPSEEYESQIYGRGDRVGLGRVTDETQRDNQGDGEKTGQETRRATADFRSQAMRM